MYSFPKSLLFIRYASQPDFVDETLRVRFASQMGNGAWRVLLRGWQGPRYFKDENIRLRNLLQVHGPGLFHGNETDGWAEYEEDVCLVALPGQAPVRLDKQEMDPQVLSRYDELIAFSASVSNHGGASASAYGLVERALRQTLEISRSVLWTYLKGRPQRKKTPPGRLVFPFASNLSQMDALEMALRERLSVIEGPPGTGKTQTILNLIANLVMEGKTVAMVSGGNAAVDNVREKLDKAGFKCLGAFLGNKENQEAFFSSAHLDRTIPDTFERLTAKQRLGMTLRLDKLRKKARERYVLEADLQKVRERIRETKTQIRILASFLEQQSAKDLYPEGLQHLGSEKLSRLRRRLLERFPHGASLSWKDRLECFLGYGVRMDEALWMRLQSEPRLLGLLQLRRCLQEDEARLRKGEKALNACKKASEELQEVSLKLFRDFYLRHVERMKGGFVSESYKQSFEAFLKDYPLVLSTTFSLPSSTKKGFLYDCLIIDEASQVTIPSACAAMAMARSVVIVGDDRQLPCIIPEGAPRAKARVDGYDASRWSVLDSVKKVFGGSLPLVLLREHYRCHPLIADFFSNRFYNGKLVVMTREDEQDFPFLLLDVPAGKTLRLDSSLASDRQARETLDCIERLKAEGYGPDDVAVVAPYRGQCTLLETEYGILNASTVHRYQGREAGAVVFDVVRNQINDFVDDARLLNVAVSRARELFCLAGPMENLLKEKDSNLAALIGYIRRHDPEGLHQVRSQRCSVFDLLYPGVDEKALNELMGTGSGSAAERAFLKLLLWVLGQDERFVSWRCLREYYLADLAASFEAFTPEELELIKHGSRLDFLIYDCLSKQPVMAFEVDGVSYHNDQRQSHRDRLKDSVMAHLGVPLIRYRTDSDVNRDTLKADIERVFSQRNRLVG